MVLSRLLSKVSRLEKSNDSASLKNPRMAQRALIASSLGKPVCFIGQPDHHCNYKKCCGNTSGRFSICKPILFKDLDTNANHRKHCRCTSLSDGIYNSSAQHITKLLQLHLLQLASALSACQVSANTTIFHLLFSLTCVMCTCASMLL